MPFLVQLTADTARDLEEICHQISPRRTPPNADSL